MPISRYSCVIRISEPINHSGRISRPTGIIYKEDILKNINKSFSKLSKNLLLVMMAVILTVSTIMLLTQTSKASAHAEEFAPRVEVTTETTETVVHFDPNAFDYNRQLEAEGIDTNIDPLDYGMPKGSKLMSRTKHDVDTIFWIFPYVQTDLIARISITVNTVSETASWGTGIFGLIKRSSTETIIQYVVGNIESLNTGVDAKLDVDFYLKNWAGNSAPGGSYSYPTTPFYQMKNLVYYDRAPITENRVVRAEADGTGHGADIRIICDLYYTTGVFNRTEVHEEAVFFEA